MEKLFKRKSFLIVLLLGFTLLSGLFAVRTSAKAESQDSVEVFATLPESKMENYALSSPVDALFWDRSMAIVHTNELLVFTDGEYKAPVSLNKPQQVRKLNDEYLIVSQDGVLYSVKLSDLTASPLLRASGEPVGCNYFDCNDKFIVTAYSTGITIYPHNGLSVSAPTSFEEIIDLSSPISINDKGEIFYVNDKLYKCTTADRTATLLCDDKPTAILSNDEFVYMISNGKIVRITTDGKDRKEFTVDGKHADYDLGNLSTPVSLSFKGENLLIADSSKNSVQEFKLNETDGTLEFTGFAVAKEKTAYNRIGTTAKDVDTLGNTVAVLDQYKLTVITQDNGAKTYKNFLQSTLGNVNKITLGSNVIACLDGSNSVKYVDIKTGEITSSNAVDGKITDISARNDRFYISTIKNADVSVYVSNEENFDLIYNFVNAYDTVYAPEKTPVITTDKNGAVIVSNPVENKIYSITRGEDGYSATTIDGLTVNGVQKLDTDLCGNVFCLADSAVTFTDGNNAYTVSLGDGINTVSNVTSFAIGENCSEVYFTQSGFEGVLTTTGLPNFSMEDLTTDVFITHGKNADITTYKTFNSKTDWILSVSPVKTDTRHTFSINGAYQTDGKEFLSICTLSTTKSFGTFSKTVEFTVLAGQISPSVNATFISETALLDETTDVVSANQTEAFVITDVNMYYLPVITIDDVYTLTDGTGNVRLSKGTKISPVYRLEFLDKEFFYATLEKDGETKSGFVPVNFTVETLDKDVVTKTYTLEKVKAVTVKDEEGNSKINLEKGTKVRLYTVKDGVALIEYYDQGVWKHGYVDDSAIIKVGNTTIRNAVIIILMSASVLATSAYFVFRKKHD